MSTVRLPGVEIRGPAQEDNQVLTPQALMFLAKLHRSFHGRLQTLLQIRTDARERYDAGTFPRFNRATQQVRDEAWTIAPLPADLQDRRVEICGATDRESMERALLSGARAYIADLEDATVPTWRHLREAQLNLQAAVRHTLAPKGSAAIMLRPRGLHLSEPHLYVDGSPISAPLFDLGLYLYHNAAELLARGTGPYCCLSKLENFYEARWWNDVFVNAQKLLRVPKGSIKATVLVDTLSASFQLDELLFELREHAAGLAADRWGYTASYIRTARNHLEFLTPDRAQIDVAQPFLTAFASHLIRVAHRRGAPALGCMSLALPLPEAHAHEAVVEQMRAAQEHEVLSGHDGTWVAHPAMVPIATGVFDAQMPENNQISRPTGDEVRAAELLRVPLGTRTEEGVRTNLSVAIRVVAAWLAGRGGAATDRGIENTNTAEICREQLWQWLHHSAPLIDGRPVTVALVHQLAAQEVDALQAEHPADTYFREAWLRVEEWITASAPPASLTMPLYPALLSP